MELTHGYETAKQCYEDEIRELKWVIQEMEMRSSQQEAERSWRGQEERKAHKEKSAYLYTDRNIYQRFTATSRADIEPQEKEEQPIKIVVSEAAGQGSQEGWAIHPPEMKSFGGRSVEECSKCTLMEKRLQVCEEEVARLGTEHYQEKTRLENEKIGLAKKLTSKEEENERLRKRTNTLKGQVL